MRERIRSEYTTWYEPTVVAAQLARQLSLYPSPYASSLDSIFRHFATTHIGKLQKPFCRLHEYMELLEQAQFMDDDFTMQEAQNSYMYSKLTVINEMGTEKHKLMSFVDFLEACGENKFRGEKRRNIVAKDVS